MRGADRGRHIDLVFASLVWMISASRLQCAEPDIKVPSTDKGKFFVVYCWEHDAVATSCSIQRELANGEMDPKFKTDFTTDGLNLIENEIKWVGALQPTADGGVCVEGGFVSPLVKWSKEDVAKAMNTPNQMGDYPVGEGPAKYGLLCFNENGSFKNFKPKL